MSFSTAIPGIQLSPSLCGVVLILTFLVGTSVARLAGCWHNAISIEEYRVLIVPRRYSQRTHYQDLVQEPRPDYNTDDRAGSL